MKTHATPTVTSPKQSPLARVVEQRLIRSRVSQRKSNPRRERTQADKGGVAAVDRALAILGAFRPDDNAMSLFEISQRCNLYQSTVRRIAQSLLRHGYLQRLEDESYQIGPASLILGARYQHSVRLGDLLLPLMRELADQTGESVSIYVRSGDVRVCLHRVDSEHAVRANVREGDVLPLERGSGGRILLAFSGAKDELYETIRTEYCYASVGERDTETAGSIGPFLRSRPSHGSNNPGGHSDVALALLQDPRDDGTGRLTILSRASVLIAIVRDFHADPSPAAQTRLAAYAAAVLRALGDRVVRTQADTDGSISQAPSCLVC